MKQHSIVTKVIATIVAVCFLATTAPCYALRPQALGNAKTQQQTENDANRPSRRKFLNTAAKLLGLPFLLNGDTKQDYSKSDLAIIEGEDNGQDSLKFDSIIIKGGTPSQRKRVFEHLEILPPGALRRIKKIIFRPLPLTTAGNYDPKPKFINLDSDSSRSFAPSERHSDSDYIEKIAYQPATLERVVSHEVGHSEDPILCDLIPSERIELCNIFMLNPLDLEKFISTYAAWGGINPDRTARIILAHREGEAEFEYHGEQINVEKEYAILLRNFTSNEHMTNRSQEAFAETFESWIHFPHKLFLNIEIDRSRQVTAFIEQVARCFMFERQGKTYIRFYLPLAFKEYMTEEKAPRYIDVEIPKKELSYQDLVRLYISCTPDVLKNRPVKIPEHWDKARRLFNFLYQDNSLYYLVVDVDYLRFGMNLIALHSIREPFQGLVAELMATQGRWAGEREASPLAISTFITFEIVKRFNYDFLRDDIKQQWLSLYSQVYPEEEQEKAAGFFARALEDTIDLGLGVGSGRPISINEAKEIIFMKGLLEKAGLAELCLFIPEALKNMKQTSLPQNRVTPLQEVTDALAKQGPAPIKIEFAGSITAILLSAQEQDEAEVIATQA